MQAKYFFPRFRSIPTRIHDFVVPLIFAYIMQKELDILKCPPIAMQGMNGSFPNIILPFVEMNHLA